MTLRIALHQPTEAEANVFMFNGQPSGTVMFRDADGADLTLFTTPEAARAVADAFNAAVQS